MKITVIGNRYLSLKAEEITTLELAGKVPMRFKPVIEKGLGKTLNISKALI